MTDNPEFFQEHKLAKRARLIERGINPYPYSFASTHTIGELINNFDKLESSGETISCAGRILSVRKMGKSWFVDIIDRGSRFQTYVRKEESSADAVTLVEDMDIGDWIGVSGKVFRTRTGEPTIIVNSLEIIGKSVADVPFGKIHEGGVSYALSGTETRRQKRYLDWITDPDSVSRFEKRSRIIARIRSHMLDEGFLEVDTPTLELVYGGAEAEPFTTKVRALGNQMMYLNISLELPLKRYIVGGFPKVFTIAKCFRNEGIDSTHNPEFTMMEWYEAFTDYENQMTRYENLTCDIVKAVAGSLKIVYQGREIDFTPPWERIIIPEVIREIFGCDYGEIDRKQLENRLDGAMTEEKLSFIGITREAYRKGLESERLGGLVMAVVEHELEVAGKLWGPCFLCDHPRDISPLTKIKRGNPDFVERFEPHIAGFETGNAYSELTDPVEQYERFMAQRGVKDGHPVDMDFIHAVACGMPPTGGVGYGIDRLVMILTDCSSIRDVIPFPMRTITQGSD